jgi:hypothetical protein
MAVPRPLLLAFLGVLLLSATFMASRNADERVSANKPSSADSAASASTGAGRSAGGSRPAGRRAPRPRTRGAAVLARAVERGRLGALFLYQPGALDDSATARSVAALHRMHGVTVVTDRTSNLGAYSRTVQTVGVTQTPSIVLISPAGKARLIEGYVDKETLEQNVADLGG